MNEQNINIYAQAWNDWEEDLILYSYGTGLPNTPDEFFASIIEYGIDRIDNKAASYSPEDRAKFLGFVLFEIHLRLFRDYTGSIGFGYGRSYTFSTLYKGSKLIYRSIAEHIGNTHPPVLEFDPIAARIRSLDKWILEKVDRDIAEAKEARDITIRFIRESLVAPSSRVYALEASDVGIELDFANSILVKYSPILQYYIAITLSLYIEYDMQDLYNAYKWRQDLLARICTSLPDEPQSSQPGVEIREHRPYAPQDYSSYLSHSTFKQSLSLQHSLLSLAAYLSSARVIPNYSFGELIDKLSTMKAYEGLQYAQSIYSQIRPSNDPNPSYPKALPLAYILYLRRNPPLAPNFTSWSYLDWQQLEKWISYRREKLAELIEKERQNQDTIATNLPSEKRKAGQTIRVLSADKDVARVIEALKRAGIIEGTGPEIAASFTWKGKLNEKPENYDATKSGLDSTPSAKVVSAIKILLEKAGPDVRQEIIDFCRSR